MCSNFFTSPIFVSTMHDKTGSVFRVNTHQQEAEDTKGFVCMYKVTCKGDKESSVACFNYVFLENKMNISEPCLELYLRLLKLSVV